MAERKRPGDDDAGVPGDDEVLADTVADDDSADADEPVGRGGTALRERTKDSDDKRAARRTGLLGRFGNFFREIFSELRKVIWPTRRELLTYTSVVIAFVVVMTAIVAGLDFAFAKGVLLVLGGKS